MGTRGPQSTQTGAHPGPVCGCLVPGLSAPCTLAAFLSPATERKGAAGQGLCHGAPCSKCLLCGVRFLVLRRKPSPPNSIVSSCLLMARRPLWSVGVLFIWFPHPAPPHIQHRAWQSWCHGASNKQVSTVRAPSSPAQQYHQGVWPFSTEWSLKHS